MITTKEYYQETYNTTKFLIKCKNCGQKIREIRINTQPLEKICSNCKKKVNFQVYASIIKE